MLASSYSHRVLGLMDPVKIEKEIHRAFLDNELVTMPQYPGILFVAAKAKDVPVFAHPIKVFDSIAIDVRTITKLNVDGELEVRSKDAFEFLVLRALLEKTWTDEEEQSRIRTLMPIAGKFYAGYVAETITRIATLSPDKASVVHVCMAYYFWCQVRDENVNVAEHEASALKFVRTATGLPVDYCQHVITEILEVYTSPLGTIESVIELMRGLPSMDGATRDLTPRVLSVATMYNWRGAHSNETVALSLEYPPAFIAMLVAAYKYRTFKHTPLERLIQRHRKVDMDQYVRSVNSVVGE